LLRALAKDPAHRFQSAEEMTAALQIAMSPGPSPHASVPIQMPMHGPFVPVRPPQTTLSTANATARTAPPSRKVGWIAPVVAVVPLGGGAPRTWSGRRGGGGGTRGKAPGPAPRAPEPRLPDPGPPAPPTPAQRELLPPATPPPPATMVTPPRPA